MAVVCDIDSATIKTRMQSYLPMIGLTTSQISIAYSPSGCDKTNCQVVTVGISGASFTPIVPLLMTPISLPSFTTSLPRESMESVNATGETNPVCS